MACGCDVPRQITARPGSSWPREAGTRRSSAAWEKGTVPADCGWAARKFGKFPGLRLWDGILLYLQEQIQSGERVADSCRCAGTRISYPIIISFWNIGTPHACPLL